jgi:hypothetical protein
MAPLRSAFAKFCPERLGAVKVTVTLPLPVLVPLGPVLVAERLM